MTNAERIKALIAEKPYLSTVDIARVVGISPAAVWHIAESLGLDIPDGRAAGVTGKARIPLPEVL